MRHRGREMHSVLAGPAADLEHLRAVGEMLTQHVEDERLVALAGRGEGLVHAADSGSSAR